MVVSQQLYRYYKNRSNALFALAILLLIINIAFLWTVYIWIAIFILDIFIFRAAGRNLGKARAIKLMLDRYEKMSRNEPFKQKRHYY